MTGSPSTVTANLPTGTVVVTVLTSGGGNPGTAASVRIKLGPMNISVTGDDEHLGHRDVHERPGRDRLHAPGLGARPCSGTTESRQFTNQTVNTGTNNFTLAVQRDHLPADVSVLSRIHADQRGFTLIEVLSAMAVFGIVLATFAMVMQSAIRHSGEVEQQSNLQIEARTAITTMSQDLRQAYDGDGGRGDRADPVDLREPGHVPLS